VNEIERIKEVYSRREKIIPKGLYSLFNPANLFIVQNREKEILKLLNRFGMFPLENKRILDVGCGGGGELRNFIRYGARPENLYGIDLLPERIKGAKILSPNIDFRCGNAEELPYEDEAFDIIMQFTVFTSILNSQMKKNIAKEMLRVLKPSGIILWYDYHINNPRNPDVKGVKRKEIIELFPNCHFYFKRVTLAPPLTRAIAPYSWLLCYLLEKIPFLCTHYLGIIKKS
jgi:ubiquinone/menaquinone biosynthesis C-methylase UbiE